MLDKNIEKIEFDDSGKAVGVNDGQAVAKCSAIVCDPSYAMDKCKKVGQVRFVLLFISSSPCLIKSGKFENPTNSKRVKVTEILYLKNGKSETENSKSFQVFLGKVSKISKKH